MSKKRNLTTFTAATSMAFGLVAFAEARAIEEASNDFETNVEAVVRSEVVIEGLRVPLAALSKSVANLALPDERGSDVLEASITVVDLAPLSTVTREPLLDLGFERGHWPAASTPKSVDTKKLSLWPEFLALVDFFHHFNFYNVRGEMTGDDAYHTDAGFKGSSIIPETAIAPDRERVLRAVAARIAGGHAADAELALDCDSPAHSKVKIFGGNTANYRAILIYIRGKGGELG